MNLEPAPWAENPDAFTQEAVDTYIQAIRPAPRQSPLPTPSTGDSERFL